MSSSTTSLSTVFLVTWQSLEEALVMIANSPEQERLAPDIVSGLRKAQEMGDSPSRLLLRILCAAAFVADGSADAGNLPKGAAVT